MTVEGSDRQKEATAAQLQALYEAVPDAVIAGSLGRAAMYESLGYDEARPLPLADPAHEGGYRDLDVLFTPLALWLPEHGAAQRPHRPDFNMGMFIGRANDGLSVDPLYYNDPFDAHPVLRGVDIEYVYPFQIPLDTKLVEPVQRTLLDVPVKTLPVGTQIYVEQLINEGMYGKRLTNATEFMQFADRARSVVPQEFEQPEAYDPFIAYLYHTGGSRHPVFGTDEAIRRVALTALQNEW